MIQLVNVVMLVLATHSPSASITEVDEIESFSRGGIWAGCLIYFSTITDLTGSSRSTVRVFDAIVVVDGTKDMIMPRRTRGWNELE